MKLVRKFIIVGLTLIMLALSACSNTETKSYSKEHPLVLRLADNQVKDYPTVKGDYEFAKVIEELTDGRIKVEVHHSGTLGEENEVLEMISLGSVDMQRTSLTPLVNYNEQLGVLMLPYLYRDTTHMFDILDGELGDKYLNLLQDDGIVGLSWYDAGVRSFYNTKREIHQPSDLEGLNIRVQESDLMLKFIKSLGGSSTIIPYGEVYTGLQNGTVDGAENNWPSYISTSHYEVAKYYTVDEHIRVPEMIVISQKTLDKLTAKDQELVYKAARQAAEVERVEWAKYSDESVKQAIDAGSTVNYLTEEERALFEKAVLPVYDDYTKYQDDIDYIKNH